MPQLRKAKMLAKMIHSWKTMKMPLKEVIKEVKGLNQIKELQLPLLPRKNHSIT